MTERLREMAREFVKDKTVDMDTPDSVVVTPLLADFAEKVVLAKVLKLSRYPAERDRIRREFGLADGDGQTYTRAQIEKLKDEADD